MITINDNCINLIKSFEGLELKPYHGAADLPNIFTIGYGTIKYPPYYMRGKMVALTDPPITETLAADFLKYEMTQKSASIDPLLRDDLTPNQFGSLISFAYNLGEGALKQSTLRVKVNANPFDPTIRDEFAKWVHSNGKVQPGLVRRRKAEADLYFRV
ncbi:MAG: lysozyme [Bacteroidetes bacterium]|nr:lysozyme [Bacteroidota bacterium]MBI3482964.1 lysozyme [Bacteroidota bacterium]